MHSTLTPQRLHQFATDGSAQSRLNWLLAENARAERLSHFRNNTEEEEMLLMHRPVSIERAYALFGTLLGALPPAAIFYKLLGGMGGGHRAPIPSGLLLILIMMIAFCIVVGRAMGKVMGRWLAGNSGGSWGIEFFKSLVAGIAWGAVTGAAGGAPAFVIGAVAGQFCAIAVALVAFPAFHMLHRPLLRGGMIDARHLWPLACGVVMVIAALILGM